MKTIKAHNCSMKSYAIGIHEKPESFKESGTLSEAMRLFNELKDSGEKVILYCLQFGEMDTLRRWDSIS